MAKLIIQDENSASWTIIANALASKDRNSWDPETHRWNGILVQVGPILPFGGGNSVGGCYYATLDFANTDKDPILIEFADSPTTWLNAVDDPDADRLPPVAPSDFPFLFPSDFLFPPQPVPWGNPSQPQPPGFGSHIYRRFRSIASYRIPLPGGLTLWTGRVKRRPGKGGPGKGVSDFVISAEQKMAARYQSEFTFDLGKGSISVDEYRFRAVAPPSQPHKTHAGVSQITIHSSGGVGGDEPMFPPQKKP